MMHPVTPPMITPMMCAIFLVKPTNLESMMLAIPPMMYPMTPPHDAFLASRKVMALLEES